MELQEEAARNHRFREKLLGGSRRRGGGSTADPPPLTSSQAQASKQAVSFKEGERSSSARSYRSCEAKRSEAPPHQLRPILPPPVRPASKSTNPPRACSRCPGGRGKQRHRCSGHGLSPPPPVTPYAHAHSSTLLPTPPQAHAPYVRLPCCFVVVFHNPHAPNLILTSPLLACVPHDHSELLTAIYLSTNSSRLF